MLDEIRAEFARHLSEDPAGRWRMDAALAHVATMAYRNALAEAAQQAVEPLAEACAPADGSTGFG